MLVFEIRPNSSIVIKGGIWPESNRFIRSDEEDYYNLFQPPD